MVVAVVAVGPVKSAVDQVIDVVAVRHGLMSAAFAVGVRFVAVGGADVAPRMRLVDGDHVLVNVIPVRVMEMPVMQVVDVIVVTYRGVAAAGRVLVWVLTLMHFVGHGEDVTTQPPITQATAPSSPVAHRDDPAERPEVLGAGGLIEIPA